MTKEIQELAQSLNLNEKELLEYVGSIGRVLNENFMRDVFEGKLTLKDAVTEAVKLWDKKHTDMCIQLMDSHIEGNGVARKINQLGDLLCDTVYEALNR